METETIIFSVVVMLWMVGFIVLWRVRQCGENRGGVAALRLSVIIPARNEEQNLPRLLRSLREQTPSPSEIIVVDDGSRDRTAGIAQELGARVMTSKPLPDGWRGKTWACQQGAEAAQQETLLFLDADTWFEPSGLARVTSAFEMGSALSVGPFHVVARPYEQLSAFFNLIMTAGMGAFTVLGDAVAPRGMFGQSLMIGKETYFRVGGHAAVKGRTLENFWLAEKLQEMGVPIRCCGGRGALSFRMYPGGLRELVEGWTKGFASGAAQTSLVILLLIIAWLTGMMSVCMSLVMTLARADFLNAVMWGILYALFAAQLQWMLRQIGSFRWYAAWIYPVPLIFYFAVFTRSVLRRKSSRTVTWKEREIRAD